MRRLIVILPLVFAVAYLARGVAELSVPVLERHLAHEAAGVAEVLGADWARIEVEGLSVRVSGEAPDAATDALLGLTLARALPLARVETALTHEPEPGPRRDPMLVELFRQRDTVIVAGSFPGPGSRADLLIALGRAFPDLRIADLSGIEAGGEAQAWGAAVAVSVAALGQVGEAFVRLQPGRAAVTGVAVSEADRLRLERALNAVSGPSLQVATALRVPRLPIVPFETVLITDAAGTPSIALCAARSLAEARVFEAAVEAAGGLVEAGTCQAGAGGPSLEWDAAVLAALAAIDGIPGLRLALSGTLASLEGSVGAGFGQPEFETTLARLAARLPAGFALDARLSPGDARHLGGETIADLGWVMIERRDDALRLAGRIASAEVAAALETIATGLIGRPGIDATDLRVSDGVGGVPPDPTIGQAALVAMDALATTQLSGRALIGPGRVVVTATLADGRDAARLHRGLAAALAPGIALSTRLSVDVPAAVEALPMPADACAAALNREVLRRPIGFAPGSVALDGVARGTVGRLAQVLRRCEDAHIEVGGHTDNQGRSSMNRRLSRARAEAVRAALQQDGQDPRRVRLSARGYGEDEPVADNRTEEGRALNRRIAFRAVIADPALSAGVAPLPGAAPARAPAPASE